MTAQTTDTPSDESADVNNESADTADAVKPAKTRTRKNASLLPMLLPTTIPASLLPNFRHRLWPMSLRSLRACPRPKQLMQPNLVNRNRIMRQPSPPYPKPITPVPKPTLPASSSSSRAATSAPIPTLPLVNSSPATAGSISAAPRTNSSSSSAKKPCPCPAPPGLLPFCLPNPDSSSSSNRARRTKQELPAELTVPPAREFRR